MTHPKDILERVLLTREQIEGRVKELAAEISRDYAGKDLVLISVLKGGVIFLADLTRLLTILHSYDLVGASSYLGKTKSSGEVRLTKDVDLEIKNKHVLLIEDIYDSGATLVFLKDILQVHSPASIEVCSFLDKEKKHKHHVKVRYVGFHIPDVFVVGYGLDFQELYRNLDCIGVLKPEIYE